MTDYEIARRRFLAGGTGLFIPFAATAAVQPAFTDAWFLPVLNGFVKNAAETSNSFAVCDFPDGTKLAGGLAQSGKTYDSVSRMMPAVAAWVASGRSPKTFNIGGKDVAIEDVLLSMFVHSFDPVHPDFWGNAPAARQHQLQVESSIVAWSAFIAAGRLLPRMSGTQRTNLQNWLASCTRVPVRNNNWAWFTAVNQAVRIALSRKWKEFGGDADWMAQDLQALDRMAAPGQDGWYTDSIHEEVYDYYNFWVFATHFLYWNRIIGVEYPEWSARFGSRLSKFLERTPYFFGANGSHVLFGRSLIYRWAVLSPLILAYQQKMWPHSPGLLRAIVRRNLEHLWNAGAFDGQRGKLRESLTPEGNLEIRESYIDNGHPYWGMQAFALYLIPPSDPFWTANEERLPVEGRSFAIRFEGPKMMLRGDGTSGEVRWVHSANGHNDGEYRDKYTKLSYSSHFPFAIDKVKNHCPIDAALVFRDPATGELAGRSATGGGRLLEDGVECEWSAKLGSGEIRVKTTLRYAGWCEIRRHEVEAPEGIEIREGSYGVKTGADLIRKPSPEIGVFLGAHSVAVGLYGLRGWRRAGVESQDGLNVVHARVSVGVLYAVAGRGVTILESAHIARAVPSSAEAFEREVRKLRPKKPQRA